VNPTGTAQLRYDDFYRIIFIDELTRGALLTWSNDNTTLDICFEQSREHTLRFILDDGHYHLELPSDDKEGIQYGDVPYKPWVRETPILLIRMDEAIKPTLQVFPAGGRDSHTVGGRDPSLPSSSVPE
jgi:hypothetical protein